MIFTPRFSKPCEEDEDEDEEEVARGVIISSSVEEGDGGKSPLPPPAVLAAIDGSLIIAAGKCWPAWEGGLVDGACVAGKDGDTKGEEEEEAEEAHSGSMRPGDDAS